MKRSNSMSISKLQQVQPIARDTSAAQIARDTALAQLRTAVVVLRNTRNAHEEITTLKTHIQRLLNAPKNYCGSTM